MGLINSVNRAGVIAYGTKAIFSFRVKFVTTYISTPTGVLYFNGQPSTINTFKSTPQPGTIILAGSTVTLTQADMGSAITVASKIASASISGYTAYASNEYVYITSTTVGATTKPTVALGTATGLIFGDLSFTQGVVAPSGLLDDIKLNGRLPQTLTVAYVGGNKPTIQASVGTDQEQKAGTLTYINLTLPLDTVTLAENYNFIRVNNNLACTEIKLYLTR